MTETVPAPESFRIPEENREALAKKVAEINKKAAKLGVSSVSVSVSFSDTERWTETHYADGSERVTPVERSRDWYRVEISGEPVRVAGHTFIGTLYHTDEGNMLMSVPGFQIPERYRDAKSYCDHCRTERRRNDTYIVQDDASGQTLQVGSNCLQDFFGYDVRKAAKWAETLASFRLAVSEFEGGFGFGRVEEKWTLMTVLAQTAAVVRLDGWLSRSKADELNQQYGKEDGSGKHYVATSSTVSWTFNARPRTAEERRELEKYRPAAIDQTEAEAIHAWAQTLDNKDGSDYMGNLCLIVKADSVVGRTLGLACSLIAVYRRAMNLLAERKTEQPSEFVGEIGARLRDVPVNVVAAIDLPGNDFGPRTLVKMKDAAGNLFVWFTGAFIVPVPENVDPRDARAEMKQTQYYLTATVKEHSTYQERKQTIVSRAVLALAPAPKKEKKSRKPKSTATSAEEI